MARSVSQPALSVKPSITGALERLIPIEWHLNVEEGPSIWLVHDDGRKTLRFDPSDLGFPKYMEPSEFDQLLSWLVPLAVADTVRIARLDSRAKRLA